MKLAVFCATLVVACGGQIADDDSGTESKDASTQGDTKTIAPDATSPLDTGTPPTCAGGDTSVDQSPDGSCQIATTYACGATMYSIQCDCPSATCTCSEQGPNSASVTSAEAPSICPACSLTQDDYGTICGFPH